MNKIKIQQGKAYFSNGIHKQIEKRHFFHADAQNKLHMSSSFIQRIGIRDRIPSKKGMVWK
jgi:hypothetical protein